MKVTEIRSYISSLEKERTELEKQMHQLAWYMRGAYDYDTLLNMDSTQRSFMMEDVKTRIKTVEDTKLPLL
jgi:hypothetical protein